MKVKCINQGNFKNITIGNEYEVSEESEYRYKIINNSGNMSVYSKAYFEVITEPIVEDVDEVGVVEEEKTAEIVVDYVNSGGIGMIINGIGTTMTQYNVAGNCGVYSFNGLNDLFDSCNCDVELFKKAILAIIETFTDAKIGCMLIFSTNDEYEEILSVLDEIMDCGTEELNNPNSDMDVKLWIKYAYHDKNDEYNDDEY